jgi:hypothetical protein
MIEELLEVILMLKLIYKKILYNNNRKLKIKNEMNK